MLSCAGLQQNVQCIVIVLTSVKLGMHKVDVEVPWVGIEIMVPDLDSKHEGLSRHGRDCIGGRVIGTGGGEAGVDDDLVEGVDDLVVEGDEEKDDDTGGKNTTEEGSVFRFLTIPQQFGSVEEV